MDGVYNVTAAGRGRLWETVAQPKKVLIRARTSVTVFCAYFSLQAYLLLSSGEAHEPLVYARILAPLAVCLFYGYFVRTEEIRETTKQRSALAEREEQLMQEARQRAAERILLLEELARQRELLDKANRVKEQFLSVLSHELRTPLNVVIGYARLLKERLLGDLDPIQADAIAKIISHARDQLTMVTDILQVTSLNAGENTPCSQAVALTGLLDDLQSDHDVTGRSNVVLSWSYPDDLPVVRTDGEKLKHMLRNLIDNAVKFTPRGTVTVAARVIEAPCGAPSGKKHLEFRVADTGIGIAPEHLPGIFDLFHQVDGSTTRVYDGIGMGLHVVQRLAALLGAKVEVESVERQGSTFTVKLACDEAAPGTLRSRRTSVAGGHIHLGF